MKIPEVGFAERLAYVRWLRARGRLKPETDAELAAAWGVGLKWLRKWKVSRRAPEGRTEEKAIRAAIGADAAEWLYDGKGLPPEEATWSEWLAAAGGAPGYFVPPAGAELTEHARPTAATQTHRGKAGGDR